MAEPDAARAVLAQQRLFVWQFGPEACAGTRSALPAAALRGSGFARTGWAGLEAVDKSMCDGMARAQLRARGQVRRCTPCLARSSADQHTGGLLQYGVLPQALSQQRSMSRASGQVRGLRLCHRARSHAHCMQSVSWLMCVVLHVHDRDDRRDAETTIISRAACFLEQLTGWKRGAHCHALHRGTG
jgi:hypothetical protein